MIKILITGVTGFVGTNLVSYFEGKPEVKLYGHARNVATAKKKFNSFSIEIIPEYSTVILDQLEIDCIIHLAGIAHDLSNRFVEDDYFSVNYKGTCEIYDQFLVSKATKFIFLSSIKAAVDHAEDVIDEKVIPSPSTAYGLSKLKAEGHIQSQSIPDGKSFYILRPCMIHGPNNKGNLNLLYKFVRTGLPYPLGAFKNLRSFLGSDNLNFVIDNLSHKPIPSGIYHVSDSEPLSTVEVVKVIADTMKRRMYIWNLPMGLVRFIFSVYNKSTLGKLTDTMVVSNEKILQAIGEPLPLSSKASMIKTIQSFHE